jgi:hypothetical protein
MPLLCPGSEIEVLTDMLANGGLLVVDAAMVEWHQHEEDGDSSRYNQSKWLQNKLNAIRSFD